MYLRTYSVLGYRGTCSLVPAITIRGGVAETMHAKARQLCLYQIKQAALVVVIVANGFDATHNASRLDPAGNPFVL